MLNYDARASKFLIQLLFVCDAFCCVINVTVVIYVYPILRHCVYIQFLDLANLFSRN